MKRFADRNYTIMAATGMAVLLIAVAIAVNLSRLPFVNSTRTLQADFANSGGLAANQVVAIDGVRVGIISKVALHGSVVRISFTVNRSVELGSETTAAAKVQTPLGTEYLALTPAGDGALKGVIPLSRTTVPTTLVGALSQLSTQVQNYDIPQLVKALQVTSATVDGTPTKTLAAALSGLARFSSILGQNHQQLNTIVTDGDQLASILSQRSGELVDLVSQGDLILQVLNQRQAEIKSLLDGAAKLSAQIQQLVGPNDAQLQSFLNNLASVSGYLANDSASISKALPLLDSLMRYGNNIVGSGPFVDVSLPTLLLPDNFLKQCAAAAANPAPTSVVGCRP